MARLWARGLDLELEPFKGQERIRPAAVCSSSESWNLGHLIGTATIGSRGDVSPTLGRSAGRRRASHLR